MFSHIYPLVFYYMTTSVISIIPIVNFNFSCINRAINDWLAARHAKLVKEEKIELMFRPFLKWLDKNLEDVFTEGLKQVIVTNILRVLFQCSRVESVLTLSYVSLL